MQTVEQLFTIEEVAKWCNISPRAMYMRYKRGQIQAVNMQSHRKYFTREAVELFMAKYIVL